MPNLTLSQVATIFSKLVDSANMGQRVDNWLFYLLFGLLVVALYGANLSVMGQHVVSIFSKTTGTGDIVTTISNVLFKQNSTSWTPTPFPSPLNPLPNTNLFAGIPLPQWVLMIGIFVWALGVMWEVFAVLREGKSLREQVWGWFVAPVTLIVFVFSPELGTILDKGLYSPIMTHFILGTQNSIGISNTSSVDAATFGNPMWILATMFGVGNSKGGINVWGVLGNTIANFWQTVTSTLQGAASGDPLEVVSNLLEKVFNPSIIVEMIILFEALLLAFEGAVQILFFNLFPLFSIFIVANPFSLERVWEFIKTSLKVLAGLALIMAVDLMVALINYWVVGAKPGVGTQIFGGWFLSFVNTIVLGGMAVLVYVVGVKSIWRLLYKAAQEVKVAGASLNHFLQQRGELLPVNARAFARYGGNQIEQATSKLADYVDPDAPFVQDAPYTINEPHDWMVYEFDNPIQKRTITFDSQGTAQDVYKLLNETALSRGDVPPNSFTVSGDTITFQGDSPTLDSLAQETVHNYESSKKEMTFENQDVAQRVWRQLNDGYIDESFKIDGTKIVYSSDIPGLNEKAREVLGDNQNLLKRSYAQQEQTVDFHNPETAQWVWKLLKNNGNVNKALRDFSVPNGGLSDGAFKVSGSRISFDSTEPNTKKQLDTILKSIKTYRFVFGKYIDENGNAVPEEIAKRGIIL